MALSHKEAVKKKAGEIEEIRQKMEQAKIVILTDYRGSTKGMTVKSITKLRGKLREADSEYRVYKNTLFNKAFKDMDAKVLSDYFKQPTAVAFGYKDPAATSKALVDFIDEQKENQLPLIKAGYMDGKILDVDTLKTLAKLPPRDVLLGNLLRVMNGPTQGLANLLMAVPRGLVTALSEIKKQKEQNA